MATEACFPVLYNAFGDTIYMWGVALFIIKVIQVEWNEYNDVDL
jgi:hypothetical protein